jgi:predicted ATP-dependent protease
MSKTQLWFEGTKEDSLAMIDLEEATRSFESYTQQLDLLCLEYDLAIRADAGPRPEGTESKTTSFVEHAIDRMRQTHRESRHLSDLVYQTSDQAARRGADLECSPQLINASTRLALASQKATALIEEHDRKEKLKNAPPQENQLAKAIQEFKKKHGRAPRNPPQPVD